jgi:hypothetical protein
MPAALDDDVLDAAARQLVRRRESRGTGADDENHGK